MRITNLIMNIFCLIIWVAQLIKGIVMAAQGETVNPLVFICAVLICVLFYAKELCDWRR